MLQDKQGTGRNRYTKSNILVQFYAIYVILNYLYRGIAPGVLDSDVFHIQTLQHIMRMSRTWDSTMSMIPKGGETIWGGLDWSPEEGYLPKNKTHENIHNSFCSQNESGSKECQARHPNYGRIISFGRDVGESHSSNFERIDFRVRFLISTKCQIANVLQLYPFFG